MRSNRSRLKRLVDVVELSEYSALRRGIPGWSPLPIFGKVSLRSEALGDGHEFPFRRTPKSQILDDECGSRPAAGCRP